VKKQMKKASGKVLEIFCDGGFGNRYNALISGLALAEQCGLEVKVYWPKNGSCEAGYSDIFATTQLVSEQTLPELAGTLSDAFCLLHDTLGSDTLRVSFHSAYEFSSVAGFASEVLSRYDRVFYYPALIPAWIEESVIQRAVGALHMKDELIQQAKEFIQETLPRPFYGLHLRRTDLNVGLSDAEVQLFVGRHPGELFFVCSDDPIAEAMAAAQPNVYRREKKNHVGKRRQDAGWQAPTADDSGRIYYSNIRRGKEATLEGVIDLLVLGQSQIVSFTGSTFQSVARLIGMRSELSGLGKPPPIHFVAVDDILRMIKTRRIALGQLLGLCEELVSTDRLDDAVSLLQEALEQEVGMSRFVLLFNLGVYSMKLERNQQAMIYFRVALEISPESEEAKDAYFKIAQISMNGRKCESWRD
jgi:tetratricopeptide (TPR) repeat protein